MRVGLWFFRFGWSIYPTWVVKYLDGRYAPPLFTRFEGSRAILCRGIVLTVGPIMFWLTRDEKEPQR